MNIKEINQDYFSEIGKLVNGDQYNNQSTSHVDPLNLDILDQQADFYIKQHISLNGFCLISLGNPIRDGHLKMILSRILGNFFIDKNPGKKDFAAVRVEKDARFYISSNLAQPMHTDEGYTTRYPRYVALHCIKQSDRGGASILVLFKELYQNLIQTFGDKIELLFEKDAITIKNVNGIETKPILLRINNDEIGITYSPILKKMWCSEDVFLLFDFITNYVHCCDNQIRFCLKAGEILIFDNSKVIHGRSQFANKDRLLHRYWFDECIL